EQLLVARLHRTRAAFTITITTAIVSRIRIPRPMRAHLAWGPEKPKLAYGPLLEVPRLIRPPPSTVKITIMATRPPATAAASFTAPLPSADRAGRSSRPGPGSRAAASAARSGAGT